MKRTKSDLETHLSINAINDLITCSQSEVVLFKGGFYCVACYKHKRKITLLNGTRDDPYIFNCPYCSSLKKYGAK